MLARWRAAQQRAAEPSGTPPTAAGGGTSSSSAAASGSGGSGAVSKNASRVLAGAGAAQRPSLLSLDLPLPPPPNRVGATGADTTGRALGAPPAGGSGSGGGVLGFFRSPQSNPYTDGSGGRGAFGVRQPPPIRRVASDREGKVPFGARLMQRWRSLWSPVSDVVATEKDPVPFGSRVVEADLMRVGWRRNVHILMHVLGWPLGFFLVFYADWGRHEHLFMGIRRTYHREMDALLGAAKPTDPFQPRRHDIDPVVIRGDATAAVALRNPSSPAALVSFRLPSGNGVYRTPVRVYQGQCVLMYTNPPVYPPGSVSFSDSGSGHARGGLVAGAAHDAIAAPALRITAAPGAQLSPTQSLAASTATTAEAHFGVAPFGHTWLAKDPVAPLMLVPFPPKSRAARTRLRWKPRVRDAPAPPRPSASASAPAAAKAPNAPAAAAAKS